MEVWKAIILGIIQGITEFLPVSSSGHLALAQNWLAVPEDQRLSLVIAAHLGTLIAVFFAIPKQVWLKWMGLSKGDRNRLIRNIVLATTVTGAMYALFSNAVEASFTSFFAVGFGFFGSAVMMSIFDLIKKEGVTAEKMGVLGALMAGVFQGMALFPGLSRSGSVLAGARAAGLSRQESVFFSFLLAIPAISGAGLVTLLSPEDHFVVSGAALVVLGGSLITGFLGATLLVRLVRLPSLRVFQYYCICLAAVALFLGFYGGAND